ncbi:efflux RND transporter periplasmic adaptor subunit [Mucilaginibacter sp. KACC 22063]|uniref:efflux RND transporter periplasmic adaptor subunit n=1 Tax=Mucilaginibacter sp. KACC 22063 TaxID=3025666 RepID=UPI0023650500|nr:efflux RND transporter periplasmic adaptor subunit [Mucilaginibacter sp. KACC 22063]WDF55810.1 efflux RND transporter periplasmic adaptor subunit [Mucilaginibacter sp. KACC 22063]
MNIKKYKIISVILCLAVALASCSENSGKKENGSKEKAGTEEAKKEKVEGLELSQEQMRTVGIVTGPIAQKNLDSVIKANGQLAVPPQNKADVSILSGGIIDHISVIEGQQVKRGQLLATIRNQDLIKIQQDYLTAKNNFTYVQAEYTRQKQLQEAGAGTGRSFQSAEATYNAERSRITAYESQLSQLGISPARIANGKIVSQFPVLSPIGGTVGQVTANTGAFVQPGTSIMEVVDNSKIHCDLTVFEKDLMHVKVGQKVNFQLTNQENQVITGTINGINKSFENESKGVTVHAVINNKEQKNLIPGMYVTALISTGSRLTSAVPVDAVVRSEGNQFIFIVIPGENKNNTVKFKKAEVSTGVTELGYIQIKPLNILPASTIVALKGAFYLQSKAAGGAEEE